MNRLNDFQPPKHQNGYSTENSHLLTRRLSPDGRRHFRPLIAVFGSAQPRRGTKLFSAGIEMGELLGKSGFDVMTGGYQGVMEAVSRGARKAGAHVVGVTMQRFEDRVNRYVMDEIRTANFYERFGWLVDRADGYIAMEGGIGTLAEVTFTWQEILLGMVRKRPMVLVGRRWHRLFKTFKANLIASPEIYDAVQIVDSPSKAIEVIREHFKLSGSNTAIIHH